MTTATKQYHTVHIPHQEAPTREADWFVRGPFKNLEAAMKVASKEAQYLGKVVVQGGEDADPGENVRVCTWEGEPSEAYPFEED